jgi:hypothetical protein
MLQDELTNWSSVDFTPVPPQLTLTYPTFDDFTDTRPPSISPVMPTRTEPDDPVFIDLDEPEPGDIPDYDVETYVPDFPPDPDDSVPTFTEEAPPLEDVEKPTKPEYDLPPEPILYYPIIPEVPVFAFDTFDGDEPDFTFIEPPTYVDPGPNNYHSTLNDAVKTKLEHDVRYGGTGLAAEVEDAIWRREEERALIAHNEALAAIKDEFGRRGFILPPQMMSGAMMVEKVNFVNKRLDMSRDVAIKQAELAQTNTHFAIEQSNSYENMMITYYNNVAERIFEAYKSTIGFGVDLYRANVERYNVMVSAYRTKADVWKTLLDGEVAKMQGFLAQIEGAKATIEMSKLNVDVYKAKVDALSTLVNMYQTEMEAARVSADIENLKIQRYKTQIDAFVAAINAKTAQFGLYTTQVDAEKAKISAWATQVDAYKTRVEAAKAKIEAQTEWIKAQSSYNQGVADAYRAEIDGFKALIDTDIAKVESEVKVYEGQVRGYEADARAYEAMGNLEIKNIEAKINEYQVENATLIEFLKLDVMSYLDYWKIRFGVFETEAQVVAQVASASLNADNVSTSVSESMNFQQGHQISCQETHYYDETMV